MSSTDTVTFSNNTGPVTVTSNNTSIATATVSGNNINITGVGVGSTTITVNVAANGDYGATSRTISVNVEQAQTPQTEEERVTELFSNFRYDPDEVTVSKDGNGYAYIKGWVFDGSVTYEIKFIDNNTNTEKDFSDLILFSSDQESGVDRTERIRYKITGRGVTGNVTIHNIGYMYTDSSQTTKIEIKRATCLVHIV